MNFEIDKLDALLNDFIERKKVPGMSVCVNGPEGTIFKKGFGFCDLEKKRPVDTGTIFGIASMSKSVTCSCLSILESEGKLSYQDPACKYLPNLRIPGTPREALLIHHLASMTSGIPPLPILFMSLANHTKVRPWFNDGALELRKGLVQTPIATVDEIVDYIANSGDYVPLGAPGEYVSYSNDCYAMLSAVVDVASGTSLEQFARDRIFQPIGMTRTTFDIGEAKRMGNVTSLFATENEQLYSTEDWDAAPPYRGCGWIKSTCEDMCKYYEMLACDGIFRGTRILPEGCVSRLVGRAFPETDSGVYCHGLIKRVFRDTVICEHSGGLTGVSSKGGFFKDRGYAATVLINMGGVDPSLPLNAIYNSLLGLPLGTSHIPISPKGDAPEKPEMYVGTYASREYIPPKKVEVSLNSSGELCVKVAEKEGKLLFCDTTRFLIVDGETPIDQSRTIKFFVRNGRAWAAHLDLRMFQREEN